MEQSEKIFLDHAAGTSLLPELQQNLTYWLGQGLANPSSIHDLGRQAAAALDSARQTIARELGAQPSELCFTSGGTEANNLAIMGLAQAYQEQGRHIITCGTEHPSVLETCKQLELVGFEVTQLPVDHQGQLDLKQLEHTIRTDTSLITLMWVNNETGLIHPVEAIARLAQAHNIRFHCDAVQAFGHLPINVAETAVSSLSFAGHKLGTPAGIGVLYIRQGVALQAQSYGGSQEKGHRAGTQNLLGALALAQAFQYHGQQAKANAYHFQSLMQNLIQRLQAIPGLRINRQGQRYSAHILNCSVAGVAGEALFIRLDLAGIAVSNGSACSSGSQTPSHVLTAMGLDRSQAQASLRISLGLTTTAAEIEHFSTRLSEIIRALRKEPAHDT